MWPSIRDPGILDPVVLFSFVGEIGTGHSEGRSHYGSGKLTCPLGHIYYLNMGPDPAFFEVWPASCPRASTRASEDVVVACAGKGGPY